MVTVSPVLESIRPSVPSEPDLVSQGFKSELAQWLEPLCQSLAKLLREVGSPATPRILQRRLGVPYASCWRVFKIVRATEVTAEAQHAPSPGALKSLLKAARLQGATEATAASVAEAADQFRNFITRHAEDRSTFESMVAENDKGSAETVILQRRRSAYRAMSQLWGVQTDLQCMTTLVGPPIERAGSYVKCGLMLQRGVRRLRPDVQVTLMGIQPRPVDQAGMEQTPEPIDLAAAERTHMPVLPEFSSSPLPAVEPVTMSTGWRLYNLIGGDVGLRSNVEFALGWRSKIDTPTEVDGQGRAIHMQSFTTNRKPLALLVIDLLVHRATHPQLSPRSIIHHHQEGDFTQATAERAQRFPGDEKVLFAGRADMLHLIEAPRYGELLRFAANANGWDLSEFDAYRIRVPFPLLCTTTRVFYFR